MTAATVTCSRCAGSGVVGFRGGACHLCGGSGTRPTRAQVVAANKAARLLEEERDAFHARLLGAATAAAELHADADRPNGAQAGADMARQAAADAVCARFYGEPPLYGAGTFTARRRPILFAAVAAAVKLEGASNA